MSKPSVLQGAPWATITSRPVAVQPNRKPAHAKRQAPAPNITSTTQNTVLRSVNQQIDKTIESGVSKMKQELKPLLEPSKSDTALGNLMQDAVKTTASLVGNQIPSSLNARQMPDNSRRKNVDNNTRKKDHVSITIDEDEHDPHQMNGNEKSLYNSNIILGFDKRLLNENQRNELNPLLPDAQFCKDTDKIYPTTTPGWNIQPPMQILPSQPQDLPPCPLTPSPDCNNDMNTYQTKKTLAQGMMDLALLSANANQLRYVLESPVSHPYYYASLGMISVSLVLQVAVGIGLIWNSRYNVREEEERRKADNINNLTLIGIFLVTIINVFISSFSVMAYVDSRTEAPPTTTTEINTNTTTAFPISSVT